MRINGSKEFIEVCKNTVVNYFNENKDKTDTTNNIHLDDVFVVWQCKTLQNNKALLSTTVSDGMYYELTYYSFSFSLSFKISIALYTGLGSRIPIKPAFSTIEINSFDMNPIIVAFLNQSTFNTLPT